MTVNYLLDACALLAYINDEDGADIIEDLLTRSTNGNVSLSMSIINVMEIYYGVYRDISIDEADDILNGIISLPLNIIDNMSVPVLREAGRIKASYRISLADSIALGLSSVNGFIIVTADHHEMDIIEKNEHIQFMWIR